MSTRTLSAGAAAYLHAVEVELDDLPLEERADLLDDLADHLAALDEEELDEADLARRLGHPGRYAAELRAAAGLPPRAPGGPLGAGGPPPAPRIAWRTRFEATPVGHWLAGYRGELLVIWWAARALFATLLLAGITGTASFPFPAVLGSRLVGLLTAAACLWASIELGRRGAAASAIDAADPGADTDADAADAVRSAGAGRFGRTRLLAVGAAVVAFFGFLVAAGTSSGPSYDAGYDMVRAVPSGLWSEDGEPISNLYVYDAEGNLLRDVLVYDQDGRPVLTTDYEDAVRTHAADVNGAPVPNAYPIEVRPIDYSGDYGPEAGDPRDPPAVVVPRLDPDGRRISDGERFGIVLPDTTTSLVPAPTTTTTAPAATTTSAPTTTSTTVSAAPAPTTPAPTAPAPTG